MDLKELRKITAYARKAGLKSLKFNGVELEFQDSLHVPRGTKPKLVPAFDGPSGLPIVPEPSLDQINAYIYENSEEGA